MQSRFLVLFWGIALSAFAVQLDSLRDKVNVVVLAFGMISYTTGPMLGMFLAALFTPRARTLGLAVGFALSFALVAYVRPDFYQILINFKFLSAKQKRLHGTGSLKKMESSSLPFTRPGPGPLPFS